MSMQTSRATRFALDEEAAFQTFLRREPCAVVLFHGRQCPYSRRFERDFLTAAEADEAWTFAVREVHTGGAGAEGERFGIEVTPTVLAFRDGRESGRLAAKPMVGLTAHRFQEWLDGLENVASDASPP